MTGSNGNSDDWVEVDVWLPEEDARRLEALARLMGKAPEEVLLDAMRAFLERPDPDN